jgi:N-acetyl-anhydromuramyl-L-alanine amidase AmpD
MMESQVEELEHRALALQPDIGRTAMLAQEILRLKLVSEDLLQRAEPVQATILDDLISELENDLQLLGRELTAAQKNAVDEPTLVDVRWTTPTAAGRGYAKRSLDNIKMIIVEHSATLEDTAPERLAAIHLAQGKPAIACHFLVGRDGTIFWTQPFEVAVTHTLDPEINRNSIAVSLVGNFNGEAPCETQLEATVALLAWLVSLFRLDPRAIWGRRELEAVSSPGAHWLAGTNYKETLLASVRQRLNGHSDRDPSQPRMPRPPETRTTGRLPKPQIVDAVGSLPKHPSLAPYPNRTVPITTIAIHHTDTRKTTTVQQIAQYHVYGVRNDAKGNVIKAQWPGIGYHFVIAPDGTIYQCQREQTQSYHVGGSNNRVCLGVSFIGRFMRLGYDGKPQAAADQVPTEAQLRSGGRLVAWLMQEFDIPIEKVMGHRNVVGGYTACPGEHWEGGLRWREALQKQIQAAFEAVQESSDDQPIEHYLLFWDHGTLWASQDWKNAQAYIAHFRPTTGFSVDDAMRARHVTIVGGPYGISPADEARLRAASIDVHRLAGVDEAATKAMLDALVAANTPWPGAPKRVVKARTESVDTERVDDRNGGELEADEWTVPENWEQLLMPVSRS